MTEALVEHIEDRNLAFQPLEQPMRSLSMKEARDELNKMGSKIPRDMRYC